MNLLFALLMLLPAAAPPKPHPKPHRGAAPNLSIVERSGEVMGASCTVVAQGRGDSTATAGALDAAWDEIARLEDVLGAWQVTSELTRLNAAASSERFACSPELYAAIDSAMGLAEETGGIFDPTIEPLGRAWDVHGAGRVPPADEIAAARRRVGWRAVAREPAGRTIRFTRPGMGLDLDGIARGYALDAAAASLRERGIARALMSLGDECLAISNREPWQVTVALPRDPSVSAFRLALSNGAISTATQSEHGVSVGGVRYGRLLDPRTGMPVRSDASVSVVSRSATRANALSAALLVMGRESAAAFVAGRGGLGVLWFEPEGDRIHAWAWNLPALAAEPGIDVVWMTPR